MGMLKKIFSAGASTLIDSVGKAADSLITSDEERLALKNELKKLGDDAIAAFDSEITGRHAADMASDSWLSKNIRPLTLAFLMISTVALAYFTIFSDMGEDKRKMVEAWIPLLLSLDGAAITFYFGSRGWEKISSQK